MTDKKSQSKNQSYEIDLPQPIIDSFARLIAPEIRKYYASEQGQKEFAEWQKAQVGNDFLDKT